VPYTNIIDSADAGALIPAEEAQQVVKAAAQTSAALALCRTQRMGSKTFRQPVLSAAPVAFWVTTGLKQTSEAAWAGVDLVAEEIATIVPVEDEVIADSGVPIWTELREPIGEAFARLLDGAVLAGVDKPDSWPEAIIPAAAAAGNVHTAAATAEEGGVYGDLEQTLSLVEAGGFDATAWAASRRLRPLIRRARSAGGDLLGEGSTTVAWDLPVRYAVSGAVPAPTLAIAGDWSLAVIGLRQDMRFETFREGVITDADGAVVRNLMQQDQSALRVTFRVAYATAVPVTIPEAGATPFPFAVLEAEE
jgi:HK97 family phage major capsid protein